MYQDLKNRGMIEQETDAKFADKLEKTPITLYAGFDPTAPSLHIGNLLPIMVLRHFQKNGHTPVILVGGATGRVGDPSGRDTERQLQTQNTIEHNINQIREQLSRFVSFEGDNAAVMVNNIDWIAPISCIEWLRDVGKHFTVNYMTSKESVRRRLEDRDQGISYTEFSYMLIQAYDFYHLNKDLQCDLQIGGSDQWGNITAGIELIRKKSSKQAYGITLPLITTASGEKFGKSAGNAVWLDANQTPPYQFYQYWIQCEDADAIRFLKLFTFLSIDDIKQIETEHVKTPHRRLAQKTLAGETTRLVHGEDGLTRALQASKVLFGGEISGFSDQDLSAIFTDVPATSLSFDDLEKSPRLRDLTSDIGLCSSKSDARRKLQAGSLYINNEKITDIEYQLSKSDMASEKMIVLRSGKKNYHLLKFS
jgi:tyrosyl-tRNA synthetase